MNRLLTVSLVLFCSIGSLAAPPATRPADQSALRWTFLSQQVRGVYVDRKGRAWFEDSTAKLSQSDFRRLTADAFNGLTNTISAKVLLLDSRGTLWMVPHDSVDLVGFDGMNWTIQHPNPPRGMGKQSSAFGAEGWEDATGTIFFPDDLGIFWRSPDGKWGYQPLYDRNERENRFHPMFRGPATARGPQTRPEFDHPLHLLAPDGSVYVWTPSGTLGIFRFDGKSWTQLDTTNGFPCENVRSLLPMPDGSIGVIQPYDDVLYFWRAPAHAAEGDELSRLITQLGDPDITKRDAATKALLAMGRSALPVLQVELKATADPEIESRIKILLKAIEQAPATLYGGRYEWRLSSGVALRNGGVLLWLARLKDVTTGQEWIRPKMLIRPGQPWRIVTTDPRTITEIVYRPFHEDTLGRLWVGGSHIDVADFGIADPKEVFPDDMLAYNLVAGPDARGRMYLINSMLQWAVFDESVAEHPLAIDKWPLATTWAAICDDGTIWGWKHDDQGPHVQLMDAGVVRRFRDGKWEAPPDAPAEARLSSMIALKHGGVLLVIQGFDGTKASRFATFFDGAHWHRAQDLRALIEANADSLRALYDPEGQASDQYERLKIDKAGNFWVTEYQQFACYDGKQWLDLNELVHKDSIKGSKFLEPSELRLFDGDQAAFAQAGNMSCFLACKENNVTLVKSLSNVLLAGSSYGYSVVDRHGNLWADAMGRKDELVMLTSPDAAPAYFTAGGHPIFCDRENRIWSVANETGILRVRQGGAFSSVSIDGADHQSRMTQTPDGRLFLYHSKGMSEVRLSGQGAHLLLEEINCWQEGFPIGKFAFTFFSDSHGALWLLTHSGLLRFTPPK